MVHIHRLPPTSATHRAVAGNAADWSQNTELLAQAVDELRVLGRLYISANSKNPPTDDINTVPRPTAMTDRAAERAPERPSISLSAFAQLVKE